MNNPDFNPATKPIRVIPPVPGRTNSASASAGTAASDSLQKNSTPQIEEPEVTSLGIANLLRSPRGFVRYLITCPSNLKLILFLLTLTVCGAAFLGFSVGAFVDWRVALLDAAKFIGVSLFAYLLCLPTLFVFVCISGSQLSFKRIAALGLTCTAMMGCVLAAMAPIIWLFAASTGSRVFFSCIVLVLTGVAAFFAATPIDGAVKANVVRHSTGLTVWFGVFLVVVLQAITFVRPILLPINEESPIPGKCFFVEHFFRSLGDTPRR